jgi:phosphoglycerate dehydrogenase-like enzyme
VSRHKVYVTYGEDSATFFLTKKDWREDASIGMIGNASIGEQFVELLEALGHEVEVLEDTSLEEP